VWFAIGKKLLEDDDSARAVQYLVHARKVLSRLLKPNNKSVIEGSEELALAYMAKRDYKSAKDELTRNVDLIAMNYGNEHPDYFQELGTLAAALALNGEFRRAEMIFRRNVTECRRLGGKTHSSVAQHLAGLANVLSKEGKDREAEETGREAIDLLEPTDLVIPEGRTIKEHLSLVAALRTVAEIYRKHGRYPEADQKLRHALDLDLKLFGKANKVVEDDMVKYVAVLREEKRIDEAERIEECLSDTRRLVAQSHQLRIENLPPLPPEQVEHEFPQD
jgi:tetratricopeptide (TPR) repeat protein